MGVQLIFGYACDHLLPSAYNRTFGFFEGISVSVSEKKELSISIERGKRYLANQNRGVKWTNHFHVNTFCSGKGCFSLKRAAA